MSETYTRINWKDGENGGTPISADNLNLMDLGIEKAHQLIEELKENGVGGVTEEQLKNAVDAYFIKNPIQTVSDIFMRVSDGYIQFSTDNLTWKNVIAVSELKGQTGKTAYEYAKDGGYTGTEEEFAKKLAQENPTREEFSRLSATIANLKGLEPNEDDIPKVFIDGVIPTTKDNVFAVMKYISKTLEFESYIKIKCQGYSSMSYDKKNFTVSMYSDEARETKFKKIFKNWMYEKSKYVLKANYIDHSHARNIVGAILWNEVVKSRSDYDSLPVELKNSPKHGAIDGFPIKVYTNGTYQGIYTWNIGKDDWLWNMNEDNPNHVLLCAETNTNDSYAETPCNFRTLWSGTDGTDWSVEVGTNSESVKTSLNDLISCVKDTDDGTFKNTIGDYVDIQSAIDYYIHQYVICGLDGLGKNMLLGTYDLKKWYLGAYDMDSTFGLWWDGTSFVSAQFRCPEDYQEKYNLLFERIETVFADELRARYFELRKTVYSYSNMFTHFERFMDIVGKDLYAEDLEIYTSIPSGSTNNIIQLRNYIRDRLAYCDNQFAENKIDYSINPLENATWYDNYSYASATGEMVNATAEHCTSKFSLQDCLYYFDGADTAYNAIFVWDENDIYLGKIEADTTIGYFTANSDYKYAVKCNKSENFDNTAISIMPYDNSETNTVTTNIVLAEQNYTVNGTTGVEADFAESFGDFTLLYTKIKNANTILVIGKSMKDVYPSGSKALFGCMYSYNGALIFMTKKFGTSIDNALTFFEENNTVITFND